MSRWTSNLLATGILLVAAVGVGRQLTYWWRIDPDAVDAGVAQVGPGAVGEQGEQPFELTFGGGYSLRRIELQADLATASERLRGECRAIATSGITSTRPPSESEQRFLMRTRDRTPLEQKPGEWQIHEFAGKLPLLVVVADSLRESTDPSTTVKPREESLSLETPSTRGASGLQLRTSGLPNPRVIAWGLVMPTSEEACTLLIYVAAQEAEREEPLGPIALPASLRRTLTLRGQGETSIGLAGDVSPQRASHDLDNSLTSGGWTSQGWRQLDGASHNRYRKTNDGTSLNVRLSDNGRGGTLGLLTITVPTH